LESPSNRKCNVTCDKLEGHIKTVHGWVKTWLYGCETLAELDRSQSMLFDWIGSSEVMQELGDAKKKKA